MRRTLVASLVFGVAAAGAGAVKAEDIDVDSLPVKKAIADRLTPEQLHARRLAIAQAIREGRLDRHPRPLLDPQIFNPDTPADTCTAATYEVTALPFNSSGTTVGNLDDYDLPFDVTVPTCTASTNCVNPGAMAGCGPRGCIYFGTGTAPDRAYRIRVSAPCTLTITGTPTGVPAWDLALIVYQSQCTNSLSDCVCVDDEGVPSEPEQVLVDAVTGLDYFIVIDGYLDMTPPPPPPPPELGPFNLSVTGTGCTLVPVELFDFTVS
jgi:hypothetical protein